MGFKGGDARHASKAKLSFNVQFLQLSKQTSKLLRISVSSNSVAKICQIDEVLSIPDGFIFLDFQ